ncbi:MAG: DHH family phosphoesterase [Treponema sp.]|jgi:nanoRNase/pAp phosphatase (c-di-AMP/oligoRNAs hydrolase)|nr:DHH family phosphoesterase [Treponema sp.]
MGAADAFSRLIELLEAVVTEREVKAADGTVSMQRPVIIQTHDYPDHDAVAAAYGLQQLLLRFNIHPQIVYRGMIQSHSLWAMITELDISLIRVDELVPENLLNIPCIVVDGNPNNTNARPLNQNLFGVVDHHVDSKTPECPFVDIRTSYGSCSTIVADYWEESNLAPEKNTATALLMGIEMDTDFLSRSTGPSDLDALHRLFFRADWQYGTQTLKSSLSVKDIPIFVMAGTNAKINNTLFFTTINTEASKELVSILADFFLRLREIAVSVIVEDQPNRRHVSVRSKSADISASVVIRKALNMIGSGGGHEYMAGGDIDTSVEISNEDLFQRFIDAVKFAQEI